MIDKSDAALRIQRFWQKRRVYAGLSGENNYDYYLLLLSMSNNQDSFTRLAIMMYGRVIATPHNDFPFLKQKNPYLGIDPSYHRTNILGSALTNIILNQWQIKIDMDSIYIPVVNTKLGTVNDALQALGWTLNADYELIEPPEKLPKAHLLKFVRIKRNPLLHDNLFTSENRWGKLAALGIIASPWVLSTVVISGGFKPEVNEYETQKAPPNLIKKALERQPKTIDALKNSDLVKQLHRLKEKTTSDASLLAQGLCSMINELPLDVDAPDIIARLSFFIEIALLLHQDDHGRFANLLSAIIHEVSLLLLKHYESQQRPLIDIEQYQSITTEEVQPWIGLDNPNYHFVALPAHSGSHAGFIAAQLAKDLSPVHNVRRQGGEYWEVMGDARAYTVLGSLVTGDNADIVRLSAGAIGDYNAGTYPATDINKLIRQEVLWNQTIKTLIIDTTTASYKHLRLTPDVLQLISERGISLIFWESCQKFGLLHTDQAQYGRVFAYCHKNSASSSYIESLKKKAEEDMLIPDVQIGSFISKSCYSIMQRIKERHFNNGFIFRQILANRYYYGINRSRSYGISVDEEVDPFFFTRANFSTEQIKKIELFFKAMNLERASFGHRYTTQEGGGRISAGAENPIDALLLAKGLKYYVTLSPLAIYQRIIQESKKLDIGDKDALIEYLSLIKAWHVCSDKSMPMTGMMAYQISLIIEHSNSLKHLLLNGSQQFISDLYVVLEKHSPVEMMLREAISIRNEFAIHLFSFLDQTYKKTAKIDINNAIKKTIRLLNQIPLEQQINEHAIQEHILRLFSGEYSSIASHFFLDQSQQSANEHSFKKMLGIIEKKRKQLLIDKHYSAADAALKLYQSLESASTCYFSGKTTPAGFEHFKTSCLDAIQLARKTLQHHREWSHFFIQLVLGVISLGLIPGAIAIRNRITQNSWNFRLFETDSTKQLNAITKQLQAMQTQLDDDKISETIESRVKG